MTILMLCVGPSKYLSSSVFYELSGSHVLLSASSLSLPTMNRIITTLVLCTMTHSLAIVPQQIEENNADPSSACSHDVEAVSAVTAWPGDSWYYYSIWALISTDN